MNVQEKYICQSNYPRYVLSVREESNVVADDGCSVCKKEVHALETSNAVKR